MVTKLRNSRIESTTLPSGDSSIKLKRSHPNSSRITFLAKLCPCICDCTSKNERSSMLYLEGDWTDIPVTRSTLLWKNDDNAIWIDYQPCSRNNTESELKQSRERDSKSGLVVEFPIIMITVQIKALTHTHILKIYFSRLYYRTKWWVNRHSYKIQDVS